MIRFISHVEYSQIVLFQRLKLPAAPGVLKADKELLPVFFIYCLQFSLVD